MQSQKIHIAYKKTCNLGDLNLLTQKVFTYNLPVNSGNYCLQLQVNLLLQNILFLGYVSINLDRRSGLPFHTLYHILTTQTDVIWRSEEDGPPVYDKFRSFTMPRFNFFLLQQRKKQQKTILIEKVCQGDMQKLLKNRIEGFTFPLCKYPLLRVFPPSEVAEVIKLFLNCVPSRHTTSLLLQRQNVKNDVHTTSF